MVTPAVGREEQSAPLRILGVRIDAMTVTQAVARLEQWVEQGVPGRMVSLTNIHGVTEAQKNPRFRQALQATSLSLPDGMPLVWVARLRGVELSGRVPGPELMWEFFRLTHEKGYSHFFYGGAEGVPQTLAEKLQKRFPGVKIAGVYSPPFRSLTPEEDAGVVRMINEAAPDLLWIGLGCPKQELWMHDHRDKLKVPVSLAIGQAFDIHAGRTSRAPRWMGDHGFEWLYRLWKEPRRLWKRYLVYSVQFLYWNLLEFTGLRKYS